MKKQDSIETTTTTTTTRIPSSISVSCIYPLVLSLTGNCVNVLIDSLNCGSIGNVCRLNWFHRMKVNKSIDSTEHPTIEFVEIHFESNSNERIRRDK